MKLETMNVPQVLLNDGHPDGPLCIKVDNYYGRQMLRIGRFYTDRRTSELKPGVKGFSIEASNFGTFYTALNGFVNAQRGRAGKPKPAPQQANATT